MIPYFGITEAAFAIFLTVRFQSWEAMVGFAAICATMSLHFTPVPFAPVASGIWSVAAILLISNGKYVVGTLFGISGMVYLGVYAGLGITRYAAIHFISDITFILGLILAAWPKSLVGFGGIIRRYVSWGDHSEIQENIGLRSKAFGDQK